VKRFVQRVSAGCSSKIGHHALPILLLLLTYILPLLLVPPTARVPLSDDWIHQLVVKHLVENGELWIPPALAVTLILQAFWGALFTWPFGISPIALRCSTVVASFGGAVACYGIFCALGVDRRRALIGAVAIWLSPLTFVLSYTFMSDVPYVALISAATYYLVQANRDGGLRMLAVGSLLAGGAFLIRQPGALVPLSALTWLLCARPRWFRAAPSASLAALLGPCVLIIAGYYFLVTRSSMLSTWQKGVMQTTREAGVQQILDQSWRQIVVGLFYVGLFVFPIILGAPHALSRSWRLAKGGPRALAVASLVPLGLWTNWYALEHGGRAFPFIPFGSIINPEGLGTLSDINGQRGFLLANWHWAAIAMLCALSVVAAFLLVAGYDRSVTAGPDRPLSLWCSPAGLVLALGIGQFAGIIPPALRIPSLIAYDRYYLPLLPFAMGLVLWSLRGQRFSLSTVAVALVLFAIVDVLGVQDWLSFKQAYWDTAQQLVVERSIPLRQVEGGIEWDGTHFYEYMLAHPEDRVSRRPGDPWWLDLFARMIDPVYVVAASPEPPPGYEFLLRKPYYSWLRPVRDSWIYVWKRE
jgi:hypothetical protein